MVQYHVVCIFCGLIFYFPFALIISTICFIFCRTSQDINIALFKILSLHVKKPTWSSLTLIVDFIFDKPFLDCHIASATVCLLVLIENLLKEIVWACCFQFLSLDSLLKCSRQTFSSPPHRDFWSASPVTWMLLNPTVVFLSLHLTWLSSSIWPSWLFFL